MKSQSLPSSRKEARTISNTRYFTGSKCIRGHISERWTASGKCISCHYEDNPLKPKRIMTQEEREEAQKRNKRNYYLKNKELHLIRGREWKKNNPDILKKSWKKWRQKPKNKVTTFMRDSLRRALVREKSKRTFEILGYDRDSLMRHIEMQFEEGMEWDNYGEWHIDHIIPISKLIDEGEDRPEVINCLSNLRPMWAHENMKKNSRTETLL